MGYKQLLMNHNTMIYNYINKYGEKSFIKKRIEIIEKSFIESDYFKIFFKDLKIWRKSKGHYGKDEIDIAAEEFRRTDKKGYIIFKVDSKPFTYNREDLKKMIIPFDNFFVETPIYFSDGKDCFLISGFFVKKFEDSLFVFYIWSTAIADRITFSSFVIGSITKFDSSTKWQFDIHSNLGESFYLKLNEIVLERIFKLLKLIEKKEYKTYKKYTPSGYITKEIVYSIDVVLHKRHFWIDSGKFKIPLMSKGELESKGYGIDELVFKDGELRRDVPYRVIGSFKIGEGKEKPKSNRRIELIKKRIFRNEEKLGKILREIFPNELIKHNKRFCKQISLTLDWNIWNKRLGFEYDGEQHFDKELYEQLYGSGFEEQVKRDKQKNKLCRRKGITLIRIKFDEPLNKRYIISIIKKSIGDF